MAKRKVAGVLITPVKRSKARAGTRAFGRLAPRRLNLRTAGFAGIERKFADFEASNDAFATSWATMQDGTIKSISAVAVGNTESTRIGRVYNITSLHMRGEVILTLQESNATPVSTVMCRVVIVHDTQTNAAELTATDVMDAGQTADHLAFRNLQHTKRFRILMDKTMMLRPETTNEGAVNLFASSQQRVMFKFNRTFKKPIKVLCTGTAAVIASITDNSIHVIGIASTTSGAPLLSYQARIRYTG